MTALDSPLQLAASYARKSTPDDLGIQNQHEINVRKALAEGFLIPDHPDYRFSDDATSGVTVLRPDLDRLRRVLAEGAPFVRVYIREKTRLGRWSNPKRHAQVEMDFADAGAPIRYSVMDQQPLDTDDELSGEDMSHHLMDFVQNLITSQERTTTVRRTRDAVQMLLRNGFYPGPCAPYGYARWLCTYDTREWVQEIVPGMPVHRAGCYPRLRPATDGSFERVGQMFAIYDGGFSKCGIARWLDDQRIPTPGGTGAWSLSEVDRILRNPIYAGVLAWGRYLRPRKSAGGKSGARPEPLVFRDFLSELPVQPDLYARVHARLERTHNEHVGKRLLTSPHLLSGLIACAHCGAPFRGSGGRGRRTRYSHAWNATAKNPERAGCSVRNCHVSAARLEAAVLRALDRILSDPELAADVGREIETRIGRAEAGEGAAEVRKTRRQLTRDKRAMAQASYAASLAANPASMLALRQVADRLGAAVISGEARLVELDAERQQLVLARDRFLNFVLPSSESVATAVALGTPAERRAILCSLVERVRVDTERQQVVVYVKTR